tara:strand:- start:21 stop:353 length:333 start_codon:yes stop_codon:yes gene_type:complete
MSDKKSGVEKVINSLSDFENELEEIKNKSEMKKTEIINMANSEVEIIQNDIVKKAIDDKNKNVSENIKKDKANADVIISKGKSDTEKLQKKIDSKFDSAVKDVIKKILGV